MTGRIKYACIGAGGIADKKHLNGYSKLQNTEIVGICDSDAKAAQMLSEKYSIANVFTDYREMLKKLQPDLVSICTPNYLHEQMCIDSLRAGAHVHCEKPLAMNAEEVRNIKSERDRSGKMLMVALNNRFTDEAAVLKKLADSGFFGEIYHAKCGWRRNSGIPGIGRWFTEKKLSGGGALIDLGVHLLDLTLYFMGFPDIVSTYGATYSNFGKTSSRIRVGYKSVENGVFDVEDTSVGFLRLENGATVDFDFSWASNIEKEVKYVELLGTKGGAHLCNGEIKLFTQYVDTCYKLVPDVKTIPSATSEYQHFADCIINGKEPAPSLEQAQNLMVAIDAIYASADEKKEIIIQGK